MTSPISFDIEHALNMACALAPEVGDERVFARGAPLRDVNWQRLHAVAMAHGLRPLIARALAHAASSVNAAQDVLALFASTSRANKGRAKHLAGELLRILDRLATAGVPAIPYKGPAFEHAMRAAPGLREMTDLDFLIRVENLAAATRALESLGYLPVLPLHALDYSNFDQITSEWQLTREADGLLIELHCRTSPAWFPAPCSLHAIEARRQTLTLGEHSVAWPAPEELLLLHITDGMKSCGCGMKWIGDVARILRQHSTLDWTHIKVLASRHGGLNVVRVALALVIDFCAETAESLEIPGVRLSVSPRAEALAADARRTPRLATALAQIRSRIQLDATLPGATAQFCWSMTLSDRPVLTASAVLRYLAGPAVADLAQAPSTGSILPLPARAFFRRLRSVAGLKH